MASRTRQIDEKVQSVEIALQQINIDAAAQEAGVPPSTLRRDLNKVKKALPEVLTNQKPGPKPKARAEDSTAQRSETEEPTVRSVVAGLRRMGPTGC